MKNREALRELFREMSESEGNVPNEVWEEAFRLTAEVYGLQGIKLLRAVYEFCRRQHHWALAFLSNSFVARMEKLSQEAETQQAAQG